MSLMFMLRSSSSSFFFFFNDTATTEIYTLSLHDALPILQKIRSATLAQIDDQQKKIDSSKTEVAKAANLERQAKDSMRSEEHTSELQSHLNLVCRLLLEKKKTIE